MPNLEKEKKVPKEIIEISNKIDELSLNVGVMIKLFNEEKKAALGSVQVYQPVRLTAQVKTYIEAEKDKCQITWIGNAVEVIQTLRNGQTSSFLIPISNVVQMFPLGQYVHSVEL